MQIKKDNTYQLILKVAKTEFLSNGLKNASMRIISKKSGIGLSNIYNYFLYSYVKLLVTDYTWRNCYTSRINASKK